MHSQEDAHNSQSNYTLKNTSAELIGFFPTEHKGIFTRHDSFVHIHLITDDHKSMGHVEEVSFKANKVKLFHPSE